MGKNWMFLRRCLALFCLSLVLLMVCIGMMIQWPQTIPSFHIPISLLVLLLIVSGLGLVLFLFRWVWQQSPRSVRYFSLGLVVVVLGGLELGAHLSTHTNGFFTYDPGWKFKLLPLDSIVDAHTFISDEYGVNRYNIHSQSINLPHPMNGDGFHSPYSFDSNTIAASHALGKKVLFFVGDSYTYGCTGPGKSYAELMDSLPPYRVLNAGIPGTDAVQYEAVVSEYITHKKLKPDMVVVCICGGNDVGGDFARIATPGTPLYFDTNAGCAIKDEVLDSFVAYPKTARDAYAQIISPLDWFDSGTGKMAQFIDHSPLAFATWQLAKALFAPVYLFKSQTNYLSLISTTLPVDACLGIGPQVKAIQTSCRLAQVPVLFFLIPDSKMIAQGKAPEIPGVISLNTTPLSVNDYPAWGNDHPDSNGHRKIFYQLNQWVGDHPTLKGKL